MHYLQSIGNDVEIIDYQPEYLKCFRPFNVATRYASNIMLKILYIVAKLPGRLLSYLKYLTSKRKTNFENFRNKYYRITDKSYTSCEQLSTDLPEADLYIAGSDQIWNTMMNNGKDPSFYLQFAHGSAVTSTYAASFSVSKIPVSLKAELKERIQAIHYVSVREATAIDILEDLGIYNGTVVLDPVFLLNKQEWSYVEGNMFFSERYILVYDFENSSMVKKYALKYAREHNVKIYSIYRNNYCDKSFEDYGPDMFLTLIKNADFILSNSFHATAFSLIYEKEFTVIKREEGINSRMSDLLNTVGLSDRVIDDYKTMKKIDYEPVRQKLDINIKSSMGFLEKVLNSVDNRS